MNLPTPESAISKSPQPSRGRKIINRIKITAANLGPEDRREQMREFGDYFFPFFSSGNFRYSPHRRDFEELDLESLIIIASEEAAKDLGIKERVLATTDVPRTRADMTPGLKRFGIGGEASSPTEVKYFIDPGNPQTLKSLSEMMDRTVAHEMVHISRMQAGIQKFSSTLIDKLIDEGLATHYDENWKGKFLASPYREGLTQAQIEQEWQLARPQLFKPLSEAGHTSWFLGEDGQHPVWTGYALGSTIVRSYAELHPDQHMREMIRLPSRIIFQGSSFTIPTPNIKLF